MCSVSLFGYFHITDENLNLPKVEWFLLEGFSLELQVQVFELKSSLNLEPMVLTICYTFHPCQSAPGRSHLLGEAPPRRGAPFVLVQIHQGKGDKGKVSKWEMEVRGCQMTACSVSGTRTCSCSLGTAYPPDGHLGTCTTSDHCFIKFTCLLYVCTHMCAHTHMPHQKCAIAHTWKSEDNFVKVRNFQYPFSPSTTWDPGITQFISLRPSCQLRVLASILGLPGWLFLGFPTLILGIRTLWRLAPSHTEGRNHNGSKPTSQRQQHHHPGMCQECHLSDPVSDPVSQKLRGWI